MHHTLKLAVAVMVVALAVPAAFGDPITYTWTADPTNDATGGRSWQIYGLGYAVEGGKLHFAIRTNFPESGGYGRDSYAYTHFSPGDLYMNVDGSLESGTGNVYGLGFSNHQNVVQQAYPGEAWPPVIKGNVYKGAVFADGTYESYEARLHSKGITPVPPDADPNNWYNNTTPTLVKAYTQELIGMGYVDWVSVSGQDWKYQIEGWVSLAAFNAAPMGHIELRWAPECGNDSGRAVVPIPEPGTLLIISAAGAMALVGRLRKRSRRSSEEDTEQCAKD